MTDRQLVLGVDVGGTFTDVVLAGPDGMHTAKVRTTPDDPVNGVVDGVTAVLDAAGTDLGSVTRFVHGTTLATNVILQRRGGPVALVTTEGFADVLRLGRDARVEEDRYDLAYTPPAPPVDPRLTFEVRERVAADGTVLVALAPDALVELRARVAASAPSGVAVCLLHSYARPEHEQAVADAVRDALPDVPVMLSSEIWPEPREYERAMTTVVCALVAPVISTYLDRLREALAARGLTCPVHLLDSAGDVTSATRAAEHPVALVESGGAAGVIAAGLIGRAAGATDVISFDMGGTTAKAGVVRDGRPAVVHDFQVGGTGSFGGARAGTGVPLKLPVVDLAEVGAGGGSIAEVRNGVLRVGPRSAGADPGPACYGRGGGEPTVTDADLLLGYLDPAGLAGAVTLSPAFARTAIDAHVAHPLGVDTVEAARAVHDIANAALAGAIRLVTVTRGIDPRRFALVAFGGAGPMHACRVADDFGIRTVIVPRAAGVASAVGMVLADAGAERRGTFVVAFDDVDADAFAVVRAQLEQTARAELGGAADDRTLAIETFVGMSVRNQVHALDLPLPDGPLGLALDGLADAFASRYAAEFGVPPTGALQLRSIRVRATRPTRTVTSTGTAVANVRDAAPTGTRDVHFAEHGGFVATPVFRRDDLALGARVVGPAVVHATDTTVVVPPGWAAVVDGGHHLIVSR